MHTGGSSGRITYSIVSGNEKNAFLIQPSSGTAPRPPGEAASGRPPVLCQCLLRYQKGQSPSKGTGTQEHTQEHLYTSKLNSVSIWMWTLTCHCPVVVSTAPSTILVPPNWTFPQKLLGPVQELAEARTIAKMQSGCSPCLTWQVQPNDTSYVGASEPGTWTAALYCLVCMKLL